MNEHSRKWLFATCTVAALFFSEQVFAQLDELPDDPDGSLKAAVLESFAEDFAEGRDEQIGVLLFQDGRTATLHGNFDIGLTQETAKDPVALEEALEAFVTKHSSDFGSPSDGVDVRVSGIFDVDDTEFVVHMYQYQAGLRILDRETTAVVSQTGMLHAVYGPWMPPVIAEVPPPSTTAAEVAASLEEDTGMDLFGELRADEHEGATVEADERGAWIERAIDPDLGAVVWDGRTSDGTFRIDEASGEYFQYGWKTVSEDGVCDVKYEDFGRATGGKANNFNTSDASPASDNPVEDPHCVVDQAPPYPSPGTCYYYLAYDDLGTIHAIAQVEDEDTAEVYRTQSVGPFTHCSAQPNFFATGGSDERQQIGFVAMNGMRYFIKDNVWDQVAEDHEGTIHLYLDEGNTYIDIVCDGARACYTPSLHYIQMNTDASDEIDVMWHEYGHYVMDTFGNPTDKCDGSDKGAAVNETFATVFGMLNAIDDPDVDPEYGALSTANSATVEHRSSTDIITTLGSCSGDIHDVGDSMMQAMWEVMFNRDCSKNAPCSSTGGHDDDIWPSTSRNTVLQHVGKVLGKSFKALPSNMTFAQVSYEISFQVDFAFSTSIQDDFDDVLTHHGLVVYP